MKKWIVQVFGDDVVTRREYLQSRVTRSSTQRRSNALIFDCQADADHCVDEILGTFPYAQSVLIVKRNGA